MVLPWVHTVVLSVEVPALSVHFLSVTKQEAETQTVLQRCKLYQRLFLHQKSSAEAHRAVTTVCSMPLLQKRNQVFERVFCAYNSQFYRPLLEEFSPVADADAAPDAAPDA